MSHDMGYVVNYVKVGGYGMKLRRANAGMIILFGFDVQRLTQ
jgi:hypothetical protein